MLIFFRKRFLHYKLKLYLLFSKKNINLNDIYETNKVLDNIKLMVQILQEKLKN